ncbi:MAG: hypothetical protein ACFCUM_19365 [Bacteroidales bacterium]
MDDSIFNIFMELNRLARRNHAGMLSDHNESLIRDARGNFSSDLKGDKSIYLNICYLSCNIICG